MPIYISIACNDTYNLCEIIMTPAVFRYIAAIGCNAFIMRLPPFYAHVGNLSINCTDKPSPVSGTLQITQMI